MAYLSMWTMKVFNSTIERMTKYPHKVNFRLVTQMLLPINKNCYFICQKNEVFYSVIPTADRIVVRVPRNTTISTLLSLYGTLRIYI